MSPISGRNEFADFQHQGRSYAADTKATGRHQRRKGKGRLLNEVDLASAIISPTPNKNRDPICVCDCIHALEKGEKLYALMIFLGVSTSSAISSICTIIATVFVCVKILGMGLGIWIILLLSFAQVIRHWERWFGLRVSSCYIPFACAA